MKFISLKLGALAMVGVILVGCNAQSAINLASRVTGRNISGVISSLNGHSVTVNGVTYTLNGTTITSNGTQGSQTDLSAGMVVDVQGSVNSDGTTGDATSVAYNDELEGVVLENAIAGGATTGNLNVMGQTVAVTATTVFESSVAGISSVDQLAAGNVVEVSGYPDGSGAIQATFIEVKSAALGAGDTIELKGVVSNLDTSAMTFTLGSLTVDYSAAGQVPADLADGMYVQVDSTLAPTGSGGAYTLAASQVEMAGDGQMGISGDDGEEIEVQGLVTAVDDANGTFDVNGQTIQAGGDMPAGLAQGDLVTVEGHMENGQPVADQVTQETEGNIEIGATVDAIDTAAGTVTVAGQVIQIDGSTLLIDQAASSQHDFDLSTLNAGDFVEITAYLNADNQLVATELKRDDGTAGEVTLTGPVTSLSPLQVGGIDVDLSAVSGLTPALGMVLEVNGTLSGTTLVATSARSDS